MADYIEFEIKINEDSAVDSQSSIDDKIKNTSNRDINDTKLTKQARENMKENNPSDSTSGGINGKALKGFIINNVVKEAANTGIRIVEETAIQKFKYSGNSAAMNKMNNTINNVKSAVSIGTTIAGYTAAGATVGGPWGAAIGAVVGTVYSLVDSMISYNSNNAQLQWDLQNERINAQIEANRLGIAAAGRGRISFREFKL